VIAERILAALVEANLATGAGIFLMLALRPLVGGLLGARAVYRLWLLVPVTALAIFLPASEPQVPGALAATTLSAGRPPIAEGDSLAGTLVGATHSAVANATTWVATTRSQVRLPAYGAAYLLTIWFTTAILLLVRAVILSRKAAADERLGPALIGVLRPKLVLPRDFAARFDAREQTLVLAHEAVHRTSGHALVNALIEIGRCCNWVNPLAHVGAFYARADQELACDAAVIARFPGERRTYAQALLKTQTVHPSAPLGCAWPGPSSSLLRTRIRMLARRSPGRTRSAAGVVVVAALIASGGYGAWAVHAAGLRTNTSANVPHPATVARAEPPAGLLTELEKRRHAQFVKWAAAGHIDVLFIGDSTVDFWRYESGGKAEWDKSFVPLRAANFGVEGAQTRSVLWRLQNGELDGIEPKVVVLLLLGIADAANHGLGVPQIIEGNRAIVAEIRKRQPNARVLLVALPRGQPGDLGRQVMKPVTDELAKLADNRTIYFLDLRDRFLAPDGTLDSVLYSGLNVLTPQGYALWARTMAPRLTELLRH
jgi:beta-lactamase regulating signal transducer with metallopeptidase domain/lysophospholipase L1-like esterase